MDDRNLRAPQPPAQPRSPCNPTSPCAPSASARICPADDRSLLGEEYPCGFEPLAVVLRPTRIPRRRFFRNAVASAGPAAEGQVFRSNTLVLCHRRNEWVSSDFLESSWTRHRRMRYRVAHIASLIFRECGTSLKDSVGSARSRSSCVHTVEPYSGTVCGGPRNADVFCEADSGGLLASSLPHACCGSCPHPLHRDVDL